MPKLIEIAAIDMTIYKFVLPLMRKLSDDGYQVSVMANATSYKELIEKEFPFTQIDFVRNLSPLKNLRAFFQLTNELKKEMPDIIHVHTPIAAALTRFATLALPKRPKVIYTLHGLIKKPILLQIEWVACRFFTDFIFTVNKSDKNYLVTKKFTKRDKIINLNSVGVDVNKFSRDNITAEKILELKKELNLTKPVIGFVGRLVEEKGIIELVEAFLEIKKSFDCTLLIAGPYDLESEGKGIYTYIVDKTKTLKDDVRILGLREDIPELLSVMDIFVLPSYREGMCVSVLEAMAMELPVVASDIRGIREEITCETGILVPVKNTALLKESILYFLENLELAKAMGLHGRERVLKYFNETKKVHKQRKIMGYR